MLINFLINGKIITFSKEISNLALDSLFVKWENPILGEWSKEIHVSYVAIYPFPNNFFSLRGEKKTLILSRKQKKIKIWAII